MLAVSNCLFKLHQTLESYSLGCALSCDVFHFLIRLIIKTCSQLVHYSFLQWLIISTISKQLQQLYIFMTWNKTTVYLPLCTLAAFQIMCLVARVNHVFSFRTFSICTFVTLIYRSLVFVSI
jgi:hypothetical protein